MPNTTEGIIFTHSQSSGFYKLPEHIEKQLNTAHAAVQSLPKIARKQFIEDVKKAIGNIDDPNLPTGVLSLFRAGMEIGAHTVTHPILKNLDFKEAKQEVEQSKKVLEDLLQKRVKHFAYPNGSPGRDYDLEHCKMLKNLGFDYGFSTWWGAADSTMDQYQLPRFTPWDKTPLKFMLRMTQYRHNTKGQPVT